LITRIEVEGKVARKLVQAMIAAGCSVSVHDSMEIVVDRSKSLMEIMAALFSTDDDRLFAYDAAGKKLGWAWLVYGNDGYDVISDYSCAIEHILAPVNDYADELAEKSA
jgi:hypothetical protein